MWWTYFLSDLKRSKLLFPDQVPADEIRISSASLLNPGVKKKRYFHLLNFIPTEEVATHARSDLADPLKWSGKLKDLLLIAIWAWIVDKSFRKHRVKNLSHYKSWKFSIQKSKKRCILSEFLHVKHSNQCTISYRHIFWHIIK